MWSYLKLKKVYNKNLVVAAIFLFAGFLIGSLFPKQETIVVIMATDTHQMELQRFGSIQQTVLKGSPENPLCSSLNNNCHISNLQSPQYFFYPDEHPLFVRWENEVSDKLTYVAKKRSHLKSTNGKLVPPCFPYFTHCTNKRYAYFGDYMEGNQVYSKTIFRDYQPLDGHFILDTDSILKLGNVENQYNFEEPLISNSYNILPTVQNYTTLFVHLID